MTRINIVPVEKLCRQHLIAEYRELPRVFALAHKASVSPKPWTDKQPKAYTLGTGHVLFFYDKLGYLAERHQKIVFEMGMRGYWANFSEDLREVWEDRIPQGYWKDYTPTEEAIAINVARIADRMPK